LWGDDVHVDFERSLNFCVGKLRAALEDDAASPWYIETVPTRGYRFIAATEHTERTEKKATEHTEHTEKKATEHTEHTEKKATEHTEHTEKKATVVGRVLRPGILKSAVFAALLVGGGAGLFVALHKPAAETPKIVVVPFHNETGSA